MLVEESRVGRVFEAHHAPRVGLEDSAHPTSSLRTTMENTAALGESLRSGATLPASWYTTKALFSREMRTIFSRYWQYACRIDEVARPGDYLACRVGNVPVIVVRNRSN